MDNKELQVINGKVQTIHDSILKITKEYTQVTIKRCKIMTDLNNQRFAPKNEKNFNNKLIELNSCHIEEKKLLAVIKSKIPVVSRYLSILTHGKEDKLGEEEKEILNSMRAALAFIEEKIPITEDRMEKEEVYMKKESKEAFKACYIAWKKEQAYDNKLLNIINPAYIPQLDKMERIQEYSIQTIYAAGIGAVGGLIIGLVSRNTGSPEGEPAMLALVGAIIGAIFGFVYEYQKQTIGVLAKQREAILKFQE
jgi:hypothetical protein